MAATTATSRIDELPQLKLTPLDISSAQSHTYSSYIESASKGAAGGSDQMDVDAGNNDPDNIPPSSSELAALQSELYQLRSLSASRIRGIKENQTNVEIWLKKYDEGGSIRTELEKDKTEKKSKQKHGKNSDETPSQGKRRNTDIFSATSQGIPNLSMDKILAKAGDNSSIKLSVLQNGIIKITPNGPTTPLSADASAIPFLSSAPLSRHNENSKRSKGSNASNSDRRNKRRLAQVDEASNRSGTPEPEAKDGDYSRVKAPANQIPINQFWSFFDQFYRPLLEEDLDNLEWRGDEVAPFVIPSLGQHYKEQWTEEQARLYMLFEDGASNQASMLTNREYLEMDEIVYDGDIHIGSLTERLMGALVEEGIVPELRMEEDDDDASFGSASASSKPAPPQPRTKADVTLFEERLKAELYHIGLIDKEQAPVSSNADDEIVIELRKKQHELRHAVEVNMQRKEKLLEISRRWMGWQEYNNLLDEINKNIEQAFLKRYKPGKSKKQKKIAKETRPISESLIALMDSRKRMLQEIGDVFFPASKFMIPAESIFDAEQSELNPSVKQEDAL